MVKVGETVVVQGPQDKHTARDIFVVSEDMEDKVNAQKLLHPLTGKLKMMSKQYETDKKRLIVVKSGEVRARVKLIEEKEVKKVEPVYDPVNRNFWKDDEESEDDEVVMLKVHRLRTHQLAQVQEMQVHKEVQLQDEVQQLEEEQLQQVQQQEGEL